MEIDAPEAQADTSGLSGWLASLPENHRQEDQVDLPTIGDDPSIRRDHMRACHRTVTVIAVAAREGHTGVQGLSIPALQQGIIIGRG